MKIGVVSDTHSKVMPKQMLKDFRNVDFIIHAGDFCEIADYKILSNIKDVKAVHGNMDNSEVCKLFPRRQVIQCDSTRIGLYHGSGSAKKVLDSVKAEFKNEDVDAVIFGHSHHPYNEKIGKILYFNPGSPNDEFFAPYCSYGILEVNEKGVKGEIIKIEIAK